MEFRVLGQLEAWRDGERLPLGSMKQRSLLALLVIHANQAVSTDQIIDELWGEAPAGDRHNALWIQVSKLRSMLEPGRIPRSDGTVLTTRCPGYVVQVEPDDVDAYRFELLVDEARACAPSDPGLASLLLDEGLALWRGRAYEEFAYESFAQAEIGRLDELRVEAVELRLDAELRCGRADELVAELQSLVHQHPLREHLSAQLMLALYRSGRQADALRAYGRLRRRLTEELGLDPSAALQRLEQQIICGDPALDVLVAPSRHARRRAARGYELRAAALHAAVDRASGSVLEVDVAAVVDNPYMGLQAFGEADAANFFGRERVIERLVARLGTNGTAGRFVAVVGPSGCGKSSIVRAGLLPAIRSGAISGSDDWSVVEITPNGRPFEELASGLSAIAVRPPADLLGRMTDGRAGLRHVLHDVLPAGQSQVVLVIDQFEEVFTHGGVPAAQPFLDALADAVLDRWSRLRLVLTIRSDLDDRPLSKHAFGELLGKGTELVAAMSPEDLQRAIEGPAARAGVRFEPGLVGQMVAEVADHTSALPLLQYALTELFDRRHQRVIELATYRQLGGAAGALAHCADAVYDGLAPPEQEITRQVMLRLVDLGDGEGDVTRRRVPRRELLAIGHERTEVVLDTLAAHRLLAFDRDTITRSPTVEISHEALFAEWGRLRGWIAGCRDDLRLHDRLADDDRARDTPRQRRSRRRSAVLIGSAVALIAVSTVAASEAAHSRASDRLADAGAEAHRLAVASSGVAGSQPDLAMLLALQSLATSAHRHLPARIEAVDALHWAVQGAGLTYPTSNAPVDARRGPNGLTGVFNLRLPALVDLAREHVRRGFTAGECQHYSLHPCPAGTHGLASPARTGAAPVPAAPPPPAPASTLVGPLAGTTVTLLDAGWGSTGLDAELEVFEAETGINVKLVRPSNLEPMFDRLPDGTRPDVTLVHSPGVLRTLAERQRLVDLGAYLHQDEVRAEIGDELATRATIGSALYWLPLSFELKGLVWYSPRAFREAGYEVPRTMDELVALANRMAAAGRTPWCLADGRGPESGWPVADWLEALVLRVGGTELYDRWTTHVVRFDDPAVRRAGALLNEVLFGPGFVLGGASWADQRDPADAVPLLLRGPPACWMLQGSSSTIHLLAGGRGQLGEDLDYFSLPPLRAGAPAPAEGGGVAAAAMSDRPEVRELMRYFADAAWGRVGAGQSAWPFIPARTQLEVVDCVDHSASLAANGVRVRLCQDVRAAMRSGTWRFDAADQMPAVIGGLRPDHTGGAFLQGMVDYVDHGPDSLDRVLTEIDSAWP